MSIEGVKKAAKVFEVMQETRNELIAMGAKSNDHQESYRLYVDSRIQIPINIVPYLWARVEVKPWMGHCPLPLHEDLYILRTR